ncbi:hypothetical protein H2199_006687 [Coniosporium tulheliwenetii]|uniref:Uncharacterized protein n=1 Tax=Coniosporium tulheliwenetii TaxID=3383036 RepID=A0ACC2YUU2_9PEZI|nr:hypothetical protein H2199_006687 [Cladosporium sp. JES 115]
MADNKLELASYNVRDALMPEEVFYTTTSQSALSDRLRELKPKAEAHLNEAEFSLGDTFREQTYHWTDDRIPVWETAAIVALHQYDAWCRHNGNHITHDLNRLNWNGALITDMTIKLKPQWNTFEQRISDVFDKSIQDIIREMQGLKRSVARSRYASFSRRTDHRVSKVKYESRLNKREFSQEVSSASGEHGAGKGRRQRDIVQGRIADGNLFTNIIDSINDDMSTLIDDTFIGLRDKIPRQLDHLRTDLTTAAGGEALSQNQAGGQDSEELRRRLAEQHPIWKARHQQLLEDIESII